MRNCEEKIYDTEKACYSILTRRSAPRSLLNSWGVFERPRDISSAYGGGKRVGAGVNSTPEEEARAAAETEETLNRLKRYREKMGQTNRLEKKESKKVRVQNLVRRVDGEWSLCSLPLYSNPTPFLGRFKMRWRWLGGE